MKSKGKRALQICQAFLYFSSFLFSQLRKIFWKVHFLKGLKSLSELSSSGSSRKSTNRKQGQARQGGCRKTRFSHWPPGLTLVSLTTSYIFFCVEEPWTSKESQAKDGFAGCGKSRSLVPHNWRKLPPWLVINSLNWQDLRWKCTHNWLKAMVVSGEFSLLKTRITKRSLRFHCYCLGLRLHSDSNALQPFGEANLRVNEKGELWQD